MNSHYIYTSYFEMPGEVTVSDVSAGTEMSPVGSRVEGIQDVRQFGSVLVMQAIHMLKACIPTITPDELMAGLRLMNRETENEQNLFRPSDEDLVPATVSLQTLFPYTPSNWNPRLELEHLDPYAPVRMSLGAYREFFHKHSIQEDEFAEAAFAFWSRVDIWLGFDTLQAKPGALNAHKHVHPVTKVSPEKLHQLLNSRRRSQENARLVGHLTLAGSGSVQ